MLSGDFAGFGMKNALPTPKSGRGQLMGRRLHGPNSQQRRNYLREHNLQCDERVDPPAAT
jgi:hypothetical protein